MDHRQPDPRDPPSDPRDRPSGLCDPQADPQHSHQRRGLSAFDRFEGVLGALISGGVFLYLGFGYWTGRTVPGAPELYAAAVYGFVMFARVVGCAMIGVSLLAAVGLRSAVLLDAVLTGIGAIGAGSCGAVWLAYGDGDGWILLLVALLNGWAAMSVGREWRLARNRASRGTDSGASRGTGSAASPPAHGRMSHGMDSGPGGDTSQGPPGSAREDRNER